MGKSISENHIKIAKIWVECIVSPALLQGRKELHRFEILLCWVHSPDTAMENNRHRLSRKGLSRSVSSLQAFLIRELVLTPACFRNTASCAAWRSPGFHRSWHKISEQTPCHTCRYPAMAPQQHRNQAVQKQPELHSGRFSIH